MLSWKKTGRKGREEQILDSKVSIIVPVYNVEKYIHQCVKSILAQTYQNIEVILVDDGSPDRCPEILDEYAQKDSRIKVIHQKNKGASKARERGMQQSSGQFVGFVDPDDWIEPRMIEEMIHAGEKNSADIIICDWKTFENGEADGQVHSQTLTNTMTMEQIRDAFLMDKQPNFMCNKLYKKELFKGIVFPGNMVFEDLFVNAEIFCKCKKTYYISKPFYCYRVHASFANSSAKVHRKHGLFLAWKEHERVCEKYDLKNSISYCRLRAQEAAISLLVLDAASQALDLKQRAEAQAYLKSCESHPAEALSVKHRMEWWALNNAPTVAASFGKLSFWADERQQRRKLKKQD